jgi:hypothetical protein
MFWRRFTSTMQLIDPRHIFDPNTIPTLTNEWSWATFMRDRTRAWVRSDLPRGDHEVGIGARGCNCFAAGESIHVNAMLPRCMEKAAAWMHLMNSSELAKEVPSLVEGEAFMLERINPNGPPALHDWTGSFVLNNLLRLSWCGSPTQLRGYELELKIFGRSINGMGGCSPAEHFDATIRRLYEFLEELEREGGGGGVVAEGDDVVLMGEDDAAL